MTIQERTNYYSKLTENHGIKPVIYFLLNIIDQLHRANEIHAGQEAFDPCCNTPDRRKDTSLPVKPIDGMGKHHDGHSGAL